MCFNPNSQHWLDPSKRVCSQLRSASPATLYFGVKFYAADPCRLLEEITRYQFFLQVFISIFFRTWIYWETKFVSSFPGETGRPAGPPPGVARAVGGARGVRLAM